MSRHYRIRVCLPEGWQEMRAPAGTRRFLNSAVENAGSIVMRPRPAMDGLDAADRSQAWVVLEDLLATTEAKQVGRRLGSRCGRCSLGLFGTVAYHHPTSGLVQYWLAVGKGISVLVEYNQGPASDVRSELSDAQDIVLSIEQVEMTYSEILGKGD